MSKILWIAPVLLLVQAVHSYIMLTANLDDFHNVFKRIVNSPIRGQVRGQVHKIARRAYDAVNDHLARRRAQRAREDFDESEEHKGYNINRRHNNAESSESSNEARDTQEHSSSRNTHGGTSHKRLNLSDKRNEQEKLNNTASPSPGKNASVYLHKIAEIFKDI